MSKRPSHRTPPVGTPEADPPQDGLRLRDQICFPLYAATNLLQRLYRPLLAPLGLTYSQYLVLLLLWEHGEVTVGEIRGCLHLDIGTVTPLLKRMESGGLVTRRRDADDERRVRVGLTARGRALRGKAAHVPAALAARIGGDPAEAAGVHAMATALVERLRRAAMPEPDRTDVSRQGGA